jgi:hypothetical protein
VGRNLPKIGAKAKPAEASAAQGTDPQGFDVTGSSALSYITSFLPGETKPTTMTEAQLNKQLIDMTPQERIAYATKLKAAGYSVGPITGAVTKDLRRSWLTAHSDLQTEIQAGQALDLTSFLSANAGPSGGAGRAGKTIATSQINDTDAASIIDSVYKDLTGQAATPQDIAKHTKQIRAAQKVNPTTTVYDSTGKSMTTGGVNTQELVTQQLQGSDLVKEQRTRDAMTLAMQELGGLR